MIPKVRKLLTPPEAQPKTKKSKKLRVLTYALHLAPADISGFEVCPMRSAGCTATCLNTAGMGIFDNVQKARIARTRLYINRDTRGEFMARLYREITNALARAKREKMRLAIRLNATSDIPWERVPFAVSGFNYQNIMAAFPRVQFYDYTKQPKRAIAYARRDATWPRNYHLTFSRSENNGADCLRVLEAGCNVAVVYRTRAIVDTILAEVKKHGVAITSLGPQRVIDGDKTDARFKDAGGVIVALYAKGRARKDTSGFVLD